MMMVVVDTLEEKKQVVGVCKTVLSFLVFYKGLRISVRSVRTYNPYLFTKNKSSTAILVAMYGIYIWYK